MDTREKLRNQFHKQMAEKRQWWEALSTGELREALVDEKERELEESKRAWFHSFKLMQEFGSTSHTEHCVERDSQKIRVAEENLEIAQTLSREWTREEFLLHFVEDRMGRHFNR